MRIFYCSCGKSFTIHRTILSPAWAEQAWKNVHAGPGHIAVDRDHFDRIKRARRAHMILRGSRPSRRERPVPGQTEAFTHAGK